ncbi:hypothetical protein DWV00_20720 [Trinickia dinghuensis]|uniref:Uncharacterized protein n=1 Tax=Trinickia dinghuensis TaxID=2291023 RepID=A0A3D8JXI7_9BURK|nr:hypothetical protein DWV00_20720 [Trinickia dinghuensis]
MQLAIVRGERAEENTMGVPELPEFDVPSGADPQAVSMAVASAVTAAAAREMRFIDGKAWMVGGRRR